MKIMRQMTNEQDMRGYQWFKDKEGLICYGAETDGELQNTWGVVMNARRGVFNILYFNPNGGIDRANKPSCSISDDGEFHVDLK